MTTNAEVNVVMSDKALVKHPQKELARLEDGERKVYIKNWKIGRLEEDI